MPLCFDFMLAVLYVLITIFCGSTYMMLFVAIHFSIFIFLPNHTMLTSHSTADNE